MSGYDRFHTHRQRLAYEAARIMVEQEMHEPDRACRKAAQRIGISDRRLWPTNAEIQEALIQQMQLFQGNKHEQALRNLREQALAAMHALANFAPRLVGSVLAGSADSTHGIRLHLFADNPEDVTLALLDLGIPWQDRQVVLRYGDGQRRAHPAYAFIAGETPFELVVLPVGAQRNPPLDPVSERPERGVRASQVALLLADAPS